MREIIGAQVIQLYSIQDFALQNKVFNWLTNHFDEDENFEIKEDDPTIDTVVKSQKKLIKSHIEANEQ